MPAWLTTRTLFAALVLSRRHGQALSSRKLSPLRLLVAVLVALAWLAIAWWFTAHMLK